MAKKVACIGDPASHPGQIITSGQDGSVLAAGAVVAVAGAQFKCEKKDHGTTAITPITTKTFINGKLVITEGATAGCGAIIVPSDRKVYVE